MSLAWPEPSGERLSQISPSAYTALLRCPKRLAFQRDLRTKHWVAQSTRTALGRVAHRLTESWSRRARPPCLPIAESGWSLMGSVGPAGEPSDRGGVA